MTLRVKYNTVTRRHLMARPMGYALQEGKCSCGNEVLEDEPIILVGSVVVQHENGKRTVDLSGSEWVCMVGSHSS
jgi:hypothetical protein